MASVGLAQHAPACCDAFVAAQWPSSQWVQELEKMVVDGTLRDFVASLQSHPPADSVRLLEGKPGEIEACFASAGALGITFAAQSAKDARVYVRAIKTTGLAAKPEFASLCPGLQLTSVQGARCASIHYREIIELIKHATRPLRLSFFGEDVAGQGVVRAVFRGADPLGIQFGAPPPLNPRQNPIVKMIRSDGLAALPENSALIPGLVLESVQGQSVTGRAFKDVLAQIRASPRPLELVFSGSVPLAASRQAPALGVAQPATATQGAHVTATFKQPGSLGLRFKPDKASGTNGQAGVQVSGINPGTQAEDHPQLTSGLTLLSVGEQSVVGMPYKEVIQTIKSASRPVTCVFAAATDSARPSARAESTPTATQNEPAHTVLSRSTNQQAEPVQLQPQVHETVENSPLELQKQEAPDPAGEMSAAHPGEVPQLAHTVATEAEASSCAGIRIQATNADAAAHDLQGASKYRVLKLAAVRDGIGPDAARVGLVNVGDLVTVFEFQEGGDGLTKARTEEGWVATATFSGTRVLEALQQPVPVQHDMPVSQPQKLAHVEVAPEPEPAVDESENDVDDELSRLQSELELLDAFAAMDEAATQAAPERVKLREVEAELAAARDLLKTNYGAAKQAQEELVRSAAAELAEAHRALMETEDAHRSELEAMRRSQTPSPVRRFAEFQSHANARALTAMTPPSPSGSIASSASSQQNQILQWQLQETAEKLEEAERHRKDAEWRAALSSQALASLPGVLVAHMQGRFSSDSMEVVDRIVADVLPLDDPLRRAFARFDRNGDGTLDADEQKSMLEAMGHAQDIGAVVDKSLDFEGFRALLCRLHVSSSSRPSSPMNTAADMPQRHQSSDVSGTSASSSNSVRARLWKRNREKVHERRQRKSDCGSPAFVSNVPVSELRPEVHHTAEQFSPPGREHGRGTSALSTSPRTPKPVISPASRRRARVPGGNHVGSPKHEQLEIAQAHTQYGTTDEKGDTTPPRGRASTHSPHVSRLALCSSSSSSQDSDASPRSSAHNSSSPSRSMCGSARSEQTMAAATTITTTRTPPPLPSPSARDRDTSRHESEVASVTVSAAVTHMGHPPDPVIDLLQIFATNAAFGRTASQSGHKQLRARAVLAVPELADRPLRNAGVLRGQIAVVRRGGVTFVDKARRVQEAGAIGLIVINSSEAPCLVESSDGDRGDDIGISVVCVRHSDGESLLQTLGFSNCLVSMTMCPIPQAVQISEGSPPHRGLVNCSRSGR